ncbi:hypothetical protein CIG75_20260 [Tumebacillus algifaecis]|uniref:Uncharacterized protein n=1 Tax=Tumebacillus algifaecis TaxID=1214604 RepID=A0A223D6K8_9BACL|nr:hypothetical protein [Tumebacillus algifaecis]ASS77004.1 hypothetical protein CIG75_20260 [Tumebacillus algifaecis]
MKRWTMILSVFFAYCLFLVGCANNALPEASTDLSEDAIGGVKIGQNVQEESFVKQYGDKVKLSAIDHEFYDYYVLPDGFEFATEKGGGTSPN